MKKLLIFAAFGYTLATYAYKEPYEQIAEKIRDSFLGQCNQDPEQCTKQALKYLKIGATQITYLPLHKNIQYLNDLRKSMNEECSGNGDSKLCAKFKELYAKTCSDYFETEQAATEIINFIVSEAEKALAKANKQEEAKK